jgi:bifunctional UDP-N-acetylglucosamine pyrophosphorylase/glucosamine-1-phosphate N-acetyltransferase
MKKPKAIILAAGKGTRMKSDLPKVLHMVQGRPLISFVIDLVKSLKIRDIIVVVGHKDKLVRNVLDKGIKIVKQKRLTGTADAVISAKSKLSSLDTDVLILYADHPLVSKETLDSLIRYHLKNKLDCTFLTATLQQPRGYGRIRRDNYGRVQEIVEETELSKLDEDIKEVNMGAYCFKTRNLFSVLNKIKINKKKKEYYLTEAISLLAKNNAKIDTVEIKDITEALGVNSREDLAKANRLMRLRIIKCFMAKGVTIVDPLTTFIDKNVLIGQDTVIYPFTVIEPNVKIGKNCQIGPFCHLRSHTKISDGVQVGNFTEINRTKIGQGTVMKHFGYLGDATVGNRVNIGAGTVTANYDGKKKYPTSIKDCAFIGSDTVLIAPIKVGKAAITAAGCVVTKNKNVPDKTVVAGVPAKILPRRKKEWTS